MAAIRLRVVNQRGRGLLRQAAHARRLPASPHERRVRRRVGCLAAGGHDGQPGGTGRALARRLPDESGVALRVRRGCVWSGAGGGRARAEHRSGRPLLPADRRRAVVTRHPYRHRGHAGARVLHGCRAAAGRYPCRGRRQLRAVRRARGRPAGRTRAPGRRRDRGRAAAGGGVARCWAARTGSCRSSRRATSGRCSGSCCRARWRAPTSRS